MCLCISRSPTDYGFCSCPAYSNLSASKGALLFSLKPRWKFYVTASIRPGQNLIPSSPWDAACEFTRDRLPGSKVSWYVERAECGWWSRSIRSGGPLRWKSMPRKLNPPLANPVNSIAAELFRLTGLQVLHAARRFMKTRARFRFPAMLSFSLLLVIAGTSSVRAQEPCDYACADGRSESRAQHEAEQMVSLSAEQIIPILQQQPALLLEVKKLLVRRAFDEGRVIESKELTDDAVFRVIAADENFRVLITQEIEDRGYIQLKPTRREIEQRERASMANALREKDQRSRSSMV